MNIYSSRLCESRSILEADLSPKIKIDFISNEDHGNKVNIRVFLYFLEPILDSQKALPISDIVHNKNSLDSLNILTGYGFISLLAGCVPYLLIKRTLHSSRIGFFSYSVLILRISMPTVNKLASASNFY